MNLFLMSLLVFVMTISGTFGALFFKKGIAKLGEHGFLRLLVEPQIYLGGFFYLLGALLNIGLLRSMPYSVLYPMTSLTYIWTMVVSFFVLGEKINRDKVIAVALIVSGVVALTL